MRLKSLTVGKEQTLNNVFLAPMAGYTDYALRSILSGFGYGLLFTELISAKGVVFGGKDNLLISSTDDYDKTAVQIFGSDPFYMRKALESDLLKDYKIADINMGCPVPKVFKNGEGSALLADISRAEKVIKECVKSGKTITVKIRTGLTRGDDIAAEFSSMAENAGASLVTVHGRVREDYYSGEPDYNAIYKAKRAVKIPIVANGGIFTEDDAEKMLNETGADGIMLARGALSDIFLVCRLTGVKPSFTLKSFMTAQIEKMRAIYPDRRATVEFRKFVPYYFKGKKDVKNIKLSLFSAENTDELLSVINSLTDF